MKKRLLLLLLLTINALFFVGAQEKLNVVIGRTFSKDFPKIKTYVSAIDKRGVAIERLSPENFVVRVDGRIQERLRIEVKPFAYAEEGVDYHVLLSANGLMEGEPMDMQRKAVTFLYENMKEKDTLSFYIFGEQFERVFMTKKKDEIQADLITKTKILGMNPGMYDAISNTVKEAAAKGTNSKKVLIIMSDGRNVGSTFDFQQTLDLLKQHDIPLYSLGFVVTSGKNLSTLNALSNQSGGRYVYAGRNLTGLHSRMKYLNDLIVQSYVLSFKIKGVDPDDMDHSLDIEVNHEGRQGNYKKLFKAHKVPLQTWVKVVIVICIILLIIILIIIFIVARKKQRKKMGITNRRCPECRRRMKDDWDECVFCKYLPPKKKKKNKKNKELEE